MGSNSKFLDSIHEASAAVLECRELGHGWVHTTDNNLLADTNGNLIQFTRTDECFRCGSRRVQEYDVATFTCNKTKIEYPEGYLFGKGAIKAKRKDAKRESYERFLVRHVHGRG